MKAIEGINLRHVGSVVQLLLSANARRATKYLSTGKVISAARPVYDWKLPRKNASREGIVLKLGAPNYEEREFIKRCKKAGEPFPVRKIQLKYLPA